VDLVRVDRMTTEISHSLDWIGRPIDGHLIGFHHLLDRLSDLTHLDIDSSASDASVRGILHSCEQIVELRIEGHSPSTIDNAA
jgi:hypothetical protein